MQLALTPLSREMSLRIKPVSQKRDAGVAAAGHERGENHRDGRKGGRAQEEAGNNRAGCLAAQDDEETEQGPFDDTIGET